MKSYKKQFYKVPPDMPDKVRQLKSERKTFAQIGAILNIAESTTKTIFYNRRHSTPSEMFNVNDKECWAT